MVSSETRAELGLYLLALLLALVGWGVPGGQSAGWVPPPHEKGTLRVMTWNVGGASGPVGSPLDDRLLDHVAGVVDRLDPDLVCLQELKGRGQLQALITRLDASGEDWSARIGWRGDRRVALLARRGRLRARSRATAGDRDFLLGWWDSEDSRSVAIAALHADAYSAETRNRSIGRAVDALGEMASGSPRVLFGDLNIDVDPDKRHELFSTNEARDVDTYNYVAGRLDDVARGTGSTARPDRRLDYIFVSPGIFAVRGAGPIRDRRAGAMDHDPVVADLAWFADAPPRGGR